MSPIATQPRLPFSLNRSWVHIRCIHFSLCTFCLLAMLTWPGLARPGPAKKRKYRKINKNLFVSSQWSDVATINHTISASFMQGSVVELCTLWFWRYLCSHLLRTNWCAHDIPKRICNTNVPAFFRFALFICYVCVQRGTVEWTSNAKV